MAALILVHNAALIEPSDVFADIEVVTSQRFSEGMGARVIRPSTKINIFVWLGI